MKVNKIHKSYIGNYYLEQQKENKKEDSFNSDKSFSSYLDIYMNFEEFKKESKIKLRELLQSNPSKDLIIDFLKKYYERKKYFINYGNNNNINFDVEDSEINNMINQLKFNYNIIENDYIEKVKIKTI